MHSHGVQAFTDEGFPDPAQDGCAHGCSKVREISMAAVSLSVQEVGGKVCAGGTEGKGFTQGLGFAEGSEDEGESSLQLKAGSTEVCSSPNAHTGGQRKKLVSTPA